MANTAAPARKQVSFRTLVGFVVYFMALLPLAMWGLWRLVDANTIHLTNPSILASLPPGTVLRDTAAFLRQSAESRLVLDHGELLLAVMLAGGIGSYIHGVSSFVTYVGNRSFVPSWVPWYLLRPFMGIGMAVIFYVVVRGGVLVMSGGVSAVDPYAMMTVAALAGMFSKQASDKLAEVFDTLFRSRGDAERADKLEKPELKLADLTPRQVPAGSRDTVVTATGTGFAADSIVRFDKVDRTATVKSATELTFTVAAAELAAAGEHTVAIHNPASPGTTSNERKFTVTAAIPMERIITDDGQGGAEVVAESGDASANVAVVVTATSGAASERDAESGETDAKPDENGAFG